MELGIENIPCKFICWNAPRELNVNDKIPSEHVDLGKRRAAILVAKRLAGVAPEVDLRECTLHLPLKRPKGKNPLWLLNLEISPEIINRGTSGPKIEHVYVSAKNIKIEDTVR